mmetsp:Transcript_64168/g.150434  ORF Transcript_64168/g.150434 Transcript_64168/m.150434 type:complete len:244 (+) Transcript_64168:643-1374(+)
MTTVSIELRAADTKPRANSAVPAAPKYPLMDLARSTMLNSMFNPPVARPSALNTLAATIRIKTETTRADRHENAIPRRHSTSVFCCAMAPLRKTFMPIAVVPTKLSAVSHGAAAWGRGDRCGSDGREPSKRPRHEQPTVTATTRNSATMPIIVMPSPTPTASALSRYKMPSTAKAYAKQPPIRSSSGGICFTPGKEKRASMPPAKLLHSYNKLPKYTASANAPQNLGTGPLRPSFGSTCPYFS